MAVLQNYQRITLITAFEPEAQFIPANLLHITSGVSNFAQAAVETFDY
jgi:hypothetical protein